MAFFCRDTRTPLQRRSIQSMGAALLLTVALNFGRGNPLAAAFPSFLRFGNLFAHPSAAAATALALLSIVPVLFAIWVAARYLAAEPDEFIRALVMRAVLCGLATTLVADAILSTLMMIYARPFPVALLNADVLFVSTGVAFRFLQWSYR